MIYKIDRIVTIEEALLCEEHKVPYIGVCLDMSEAICQPVHLRKVNIEQALEIRSRLSSTKVVFELPILKMTKSHFQFLRDYEIDYVQLFFNVGLEEKDLQNLREASIQLFITGQDIGPDDDPTWLIPPFLEAN
ncbi:MAG TPA: hypothetical protein ENI91_07645, partial [Sphingomonadales bacterium]|nr:hypothetical protein [Sphingomonadales bacterium]